MRKPVSMMIMAGLLMLLAGSVQADGPRANLAGSKAETLDDCVEPTEDMRRNHMEYLLHQRDLAVHQGIRTEKHSLAECVACHVSKDDKGEYVSINGEGQFCESCHEFTSVRLDCFECHATVPRSRGAYFHTLAPPMTAMNDAHHPATGDALKNQFATTLEFITGKQK